ncbi:MAG: hypothetical protein O7G83_02455 [Proteobacteria bacterium]|nr:hypothetical protein [Pseudomonadota bacterium]
MRDIASHAPRPQALGGPKALGSRRSGRAGEPAAGELMGASESLDDAPLRPRLPSYPPFALDGRAAPTVGMIDRAFRHGARFGRRDEQLGSYPRTTAGQMAAVRQELDDHYETRAGPSNKPSHEVPNSNFPVATGLDHVEGRRLAP